MLGGKPGIVDGTDPRATARCRSPKGCERFTSSKSREDAVKAMVFTGEADRALFCSQSTADRCVDIAHARRLRTWLAPRRRATV
ncbi:hypothetical protein GCM10023205_74220 [Yinghuangia aomiensis]|uniref:Uncharacterized protein n=1 Tax=Yinghuangia aomiensis TaxID=676205 RepID=A0ABP9I9M9_9ACTN